MTLTRGYQYGPLAAFQRSRCYHAAPMADLADQIRIRLLPALLTALGVAGLAGGMLSLTSGVVAEPLPTPIVVASVEPTSAPLITFPPRSTVVPPSTSPTPPADRVATRVRVAALDIDLPIIRQTTKKVPCNVAMYLEDRRLGQPGFGRATYLYAHAQTGMFLPILEASRSQDGRSMLGMVVEVWTSDDQKLLYEITEVRRHVAATPDASGMDDALAAGSEQLWLQTSEGPGVAEGQPRNPVLQVVALPISQQAADPSDAHPNAEPIICT